MRGLAFVSKRLVWLLCGMAGVVILLWILLAALFFLEPAGSLPLASNAMLKQSRQGSFNQTTTPPQDNFTQISNNLQSLKIELNGSAPQAPEAIEETWQKTINSILLDDGDAALISERLAAVLPGMPLEGQMEAAQHMVNLLSDDRYFTAEAVYFNSAMADPVRRLVFEDFMNRPNTVKLPLLVRTVRETGHPFRTEALDNLQVYIGQDEGEDWTRWDAVVRKTLERERQEPDAQSLP